MAEHRNVILVTVDSLRADRCGYIGCDRGLTPTLDRLAEDGLAFTNAVAPAGSTGGAVPSIHTGVYPFDRPDQDDPKRAHMSARKTLAERFKEMGYETGAFTSNPWTSRFFHFNQGFDHFEDFMEETSSNRFSPDEDSSGSLRSGLGRMLDWWRGQEMFMSWESYYDDIHSWLDSTTQPYFLWVFTVDVHMPYIPPRKYRSASLPMVYGANSWLYGGANQRFESIFRPRLLSAYDDTVRYTDALVERLLSDAPGDPIICVHADHGELFGEGGHYGHGKLYEPVIHVPLVVGNVDSDTVQEPVSLRRTPELLTGLATGDRPKVSEPYVTTRNRGSMRVVRGANWRYESTQSSESASTRTNGTWETHSEHPLYDVGRAVVERREAGDSERERVAASTQDISEN